MEGDKPDFSKGSFYANPLTENLTENMLDRRRYQRSRQTSKNNLGGSKDVNMEELLQWDESFNETDDQICALADSCPAFFAPNVWPSKHLPELESAFKEVGQLVQNVGTMVARCCDSYVAGQVSLDFVT